MGFGEIDTIRMVLELIQEYGVEVVLLVVFVVWLMFISKSQNRRMDKLVDAVLVELGSHSEKVIAPVVTQEVANFDKKIEHGLYSLMEKAGGDRTYLFQFHNGTILSSGIHHRLMSITHEVMKAGVEPTMLNMKNLPISGFPYIIGKLLDENRTPVVIDLGKVSDVNTQVLWEKGNGAEQLIIFPVTLFSNSEVLIGFIGVDFLDRIENSKIESDEFVKEFNVWSKYISTLMEQEKNLF